MPQTFDANGIVTGGTPDPTPPPASPPDAPLEQRPPNISLERRQFEFYVTHPAHGVIPVALSLLLVQEWGAQITVALAHERRELMAQAAAAPPIGGGPAAPVEAPVEAPKILAPRAARPRGLRKLRS